MKIKFLTILALLVAQASIAQIGAGNLMVGGALEISTNDNQNSFTLAPTGYYFISDQLALGGSVRFGTTRDNPGDDNYVRNNSFGFIPSARYFWSLNEQIYFYGQGSVGLTFGNQKLYLGNTSTDTASNTEFSIALGTGLMYVISSKVGVDLGLNLVRFGSNSVTTPTGPGGADETTSSSSFRLGVNTFAPSLGLYYIF